MRATDFGISLPSRIFVIESRSPRVRSGSANSIHRPCPPALDGAIDGWESCEAVTFGEGACKVEVRGMYDLDHLYLRWHVRSDAAIRIKPLEPVDRLFTHDRGADTFGVYFQGSPAAGFVRRDLSGRYDGDMARTRKMNRVLTWMPVTIPEVHRHRAIRGWLNGDPLPATLGEGKRAADLRQRIDSSRPMSLRKGWNELLIRVDHIWGDSAITVRLDAPATTLWKLRTSNQQPEK